MSRRSVTQLITTVEKPPNINRILTECNCCSRQCFGEDVLVDMWCFRRWGHNEMDDPTFTNPVMYREIQSREAVPDLYAKRLVVSVHR